MRQEDSKFKASLSILVRPSRNENTKRAGDIQITSKVLGSKARKREKKLDLFWDPVVVGWALIPAAGTAGPAGHS